ncbi:hypothetical protein LAWI1_G008316 [Lachnellula willkommii]|uniref:Transposase Tc1-like domain-containing protein n=1 Tax=Lachnellula willkommii TaxID=215461 RepID=A0A559LYH2_9HELO|nr:hypothetical protein LAWI1_G008316 [Lachnellula willkommii]
MPARKRLVDWQDIPAILRWDYGEKAIRTALKREGFTRRVERKKCPLTADHAADRLTWALEHVNWTDEQ